MPESEEHEGQVAPVPTGQGVDLPVDERADRAAKPIPPRYWWLKRLSIAGGCLLVALIVLRVWWGWEAGRRLQAEIDKYIAAGEPVFIADFEAQLAEVPDDQNAAILIEEAGSLAVFVTADGVDSEDYTYDHEKVAKDLDNVRKLMAANARSLALVREARSRPLAAWKHGLDVQSRAATGRSWGGYRQISKMLRLATSFHYHNGNHAEVVEAIEDQIFLSEALQADPHLIASLVAWAIEGLAFGCVEWFGATLVVDDKLDPSGDAVTPADRLQVEKLILDLLNEQTPRELAIRARHGSRAQNLDFLQAIDRFGWGAYAGRFMGPTVADRVRSLLSRPIVVLDTLRAMRVESLAAEALKEKDWPAARKHFPGDAAESWRPAEPPSLLRRVSRPLTETPFGSYSGSSPTGVRMFFQNLAKRRMTAVALAIRLYEVDKGRRPDDLSELVPEYLATVPRDPFSPEGGPILYRPTGEEPTLYSVGSDGRDDGGVERDLRRGPDGTRKGDHLFHLDGPPREPEENESPEGGDDNENAEQHEGQTDKDKGPFS